MTVEEALQSHLAGYLYLVSGRVYPVQLPDAKNFSVWLPAITYQRVSHLPTKHRSSRRSSHGRARFQFDIWGDTYAQAISTRAIFFDAMADFVRDSNPRVDVSLVQDYRDAYEAEPGRWRAIVDYYIWHTER